MRIGGGWIRPRVFAFVVLVMVVGAAVGYLRRATTPDNWASLVLGLVLATVLLLSIALAVTYLVFVRVVEIHPDNVVFLLGTRRIAVGWGDLVPPVSPLMLGVTFEYRVGGQVQEQTSLFVTREQAQAILTHPRCPRFQIDAKLWRGLGLVAPAGG